MREELRQPLAEAWALVRLGRLPEALLRLYRLDLEGVSDPLTALARGEAHLKAGRLEPAAREFEVSLRCPDLAAASWDRLGRALSFAPGEDSVARAVEAFRRGLASPGAQPAALLELHYDLASLFCLTGRLAEALRELDALVRLDPGYRDVRNWVERLRDELGPGHGGPGVVAPRPEGPVTPSAGAARPWPPDED